MKPWNLEVAPSACSDQVFFQARLHAISSCFILIYLSPSVKQYSSGKSLFHAADFSLLKHEDCILPVLSAKKTRRLSLGVPALDDVFPGFKFGDFIVLGGHAASFISFFLSVRAQLPPRRGGLASSAVFVDGGNSFSPYLVAEIARSYGLDSRSVLEKVYVSRAFTAYQLSYLILEKLEPFLKRERPKLLIVSDVTSLFSDRDIPKTEAKDLFMKSCSKLSEIAAKKKSIVFATYFPRRKFRRGVFFEAVLFGRSNVSVRFNKKGRFLNFVLEDHPNAKHLTMDFTLDFQATDYAPCIFWGGETLYLNQ